jgi:hypothetical protein
MSSEELPSYLSLEEALAALEHLLRHPPSDESSPEYSNWEGVVTHTETEASQLGASTFQLEIIALTILLLEERQKAFNDLFIGPLSTEDLRALQDIFELNWPDQLYRSIRERPYLTEE